MVLTYISIVFGLLFGIILKDLRIVGIGIILSVLFWMLEFYKNGRKR